MDGSLVMPAKGHDFYAPALGPRMIIAGEHAPEDLTTPFI